VSWELALTALGLVAVLEGLVFALAPLHFEDLLAALREMPVPTRRMIGLAIIALGVLLILLARAAAA
jgi:uncharacterized protein YjeT (DUF2065 family)